MKFNARTFQRLLSALAVLSAVAISAHGATPPPAPPRAQDSSADTFAAMRQSMSWEIALVPHTGTGSADVEVIKAQEAVRSAVDPRPHLERLGWMYVAKARASHDNGFYKLAEQCAVTLLAYDKRNLGALLLSGHIAQSLHRFKDAEVIARQLVAARELAFDYGLLGDALVDQGKVDEAIGAYQRMVELRPELQSYSRVAHVRWLKGDLSGAIDAAQLAAGASSPHQAEPAAWAFTRLATLQAQAGAMASAEAACASAREFVADYAPVLLQQGRMRLAAGQSAEAVDLLRRAAERNPLPEYQWALAEAFRAAGRDREAGIVEAELERTGAANDPRTLALFLATQGRQTELAVHLASRELKERSDVFTHDAMAWAQTSAGRTEEAWISMERALAEGTQDARLFLHAAVIAVRLGRDDAPGRIDRARTLERLLLPSEREHLANAARLLPQKVAATGAARP